MTGAFTKIHMEKQVRNVTQNNEQNLLVEKIPEILVV